MAFTNDDKKFLKILLEETVVEKIDEKMKNYVGNLPTKEEFYSRMDKMMFELKAIREEQVMLSQHDKDQSDDIEKLKKIHPKNTHDPVFV